MQVRLHYKGHEVTVKPPKKGLEGKYVITIGHLVQARPYVKRLKLRGKKLRVYWDKNYGPRFNRLLQGALNQFFKEVSV